MKSFSAEYKEVIRFGEAEHLEAHEFDKEAILAIKTALGAKRPLLLRGEPGCGKTHLAIAAAVKAKAKFVGETVDALTSPQDLRWREDAVARLAEAQMAGLTARKGQRLSDRRKQLNRKNFIVPGPLWWGFEWDTAERLAQRNNISAPPQPKSESIPNHENGVVVLIDEIDKAPPDVPDALLEALGSRQFTPPNHNPVTARNWPLVIITTNNQRSLPDAFLRRCIIHDIVLPESFERLKEWLFNRGRVHFREEELSDTILQQAAEMLAEDRESAIKEGWSPIPGQAEYLDMLRAVLQISQQERCDPEDLMKRIRRFTFQKKSPIRPQLER